MISLIAAVSTNRVIGNENELPWRLPADLKHFQRLTMSHHLIMGRKTFESIGARPLPGREIIVLSRQPGASYRRVSIASSLDEATAMAAKDSEIFIAGGSAVYREGLKVADRLYLTWVHAEVDGNVFFPRLRTREWMLETREDRPQDERNRYAMSFLQIGRSRGGRHLTPDEVPEQWLE